MTVILESWFIYSAQQMVKSQLSASCLCEWHPDVPEVSTASGVTIHESQGCEKHDNGCSRDNTRIIRDTVFIYGLDTMIQ